MQKGSKNEEAITRADFVYMETLDSNDKISSSNYLIRIILTIIYAQDTSVVSLLVSSEA